MTNYCHISNYTSAVFQMSDNLSRSYLGPALLGIALTGMAGYAQIFLALITIPRSYWTLSVPATQEGG